MAENLATHRHEAQVEQVLAWLAAAAKSRGKYTPTLALGRDGVMVPMRSCWEEASTATISVQDRAGRRLGTVYLGRLLESGQGTLTAQLTQLLVVVLAAWQGPLPRLVYVTDAGNHPQDFYHRVRRRMKHPCTGPPPLSESPCMLPSKKISHCSSGRKRVLESDFGPRAIPPSDQELAVDRVVLGLTKSAAQRDRRRSLGASPNSR